MSGGVPAGCICGQRFAMCEDGHAIDCPASSQYATWLKMRATVAAAHTPTPPIEGRDADVERVARAMCVADGLDPDEHIVGGQATGFEDFGPLWQAEDRSEGQLGLTDYTGLARAALQALGERPHAD